MVEKKEKGSPPEEKAPTGPVCSNCGSTTKTQVGGYLRCPNCGNEERGD